MVETVEFKFWMCSALFGSSSSFILLLFHSETSAIASSQIGAHAHTKYPRVCRVCVEQILPHRSKFREQEERGKEAVIIMTTWQQQQHRQLTSTTKWKTMKICIWFMNSEHWTLNTELYSSVVYVFAFFYVKYVCMYHNHLECDVMWWMVCVSALCAHIKPWSIFLMILCLYHIASGNLCLLAYSMRWFMCAEHIHDSVYTMFPY